MQQIDQIQWALIGPKINLQFLLLFLTTNINQLQIPDKERTKPDKWYFGCGDFHKLRGQMRGIANR